MPRRPFRKYLTLWVVLSLVFALFAAVCPQCEAEAHGEAPAPVAHADGRPFANDWSTEGGNCSCCETNRCEEEEEIPDGVRQRTAPSATPVPAVATFPAPSAFCVAARPERFIPFSTRTRIYVQHASFLC